MSGEWIGRNRTGVTASPGLAKAMQEDEGLAVPMPPGTGEEIAIVRQHYANAGEAIGSISLPSSPKGAARAALAALKGDHLMILIDKLGERLAFERSSVRLYQALISKYDAYGSWEGGPTKSDLELIAHDELAHFHAVREAIEELGGDPTIVTPSADVTDIASFGLRQLVADPRTDLRQSITAAFTAELVDNEAWITLIGLVQPVDPKTAERFQCALDDEMRHLAAVREWVLASVELSANDIVERVASPMLRSADPNA
jgi:ferritin-like protein